MSVSANRYITLFSGFYGVVQQPNSFGSFLVAIFITNLLLYFMFYIIMKVFGNIFHTSFSVTVSSQIFFLAEMQGKGALRNCVFGDVQPVHMDGRSLLFQGRKHKLAGRLVFVVIKRHYQQSVELNEVMLMSSCRRLGPEP